MARLAEGGEGEEELMLDEALINYGRFSKRSVVSTF
jgi:hypothetical protein